jgi:hypothetical protein
VGVGRAFSVGYRRAFGVEGVTVAVERGLDCTRVGGFEADTRCVGSIMECWSFLDLERDRERVRKL